MKGIKFIKPYPPYKVGDIAGFKDDEAEALIKGEVAEGYQAEKKAEVKSVDSPPVDKMVKRPKTKK